MAPWPHSCAVYHHPSPPISPLPNTRLLYYCAWLRLHFSNNHECNPLSPHLYPPPPPPPQNIRPDRQTVMFSATFPRAVEALARKVLQDPVEIQVRPVECYTCVALV